jgi:hypothetical protein
MAKVIIGVDPHKLSATIEVVDQHEKLLGSGRFKTDNAGYTVMRSYVRAWPDRVWAVEGSNGAGRPLAWRTFLLALDDLALCLQADLADARAEDAVDFQAEAMSDAGVYLRTATCPPAVFHELIFKTFKRTQGGVNRLLAGHLFPAVVPRPAWSARSRKQGVPFGT